VGTPPCGYVKGEREMARPGKGQKRTWRFKLDDATTLEVSAPVGATEKQVRRRGRISLLLVMTAVALSVVAAGLADNAISDGDGVTPVTNQNMAFGNVDCGVASNKTALVAISRNGSYTPGTQVFAKSTNASVSVNSVTITTGDGLSAAMSGSTTIAIPSNWDAATNNTLTSTVSSLVTVDSSTPGAGVGTVTYRAAGTNPGGDAINRDDPMTVTWNVLDNCAPPNQAPTVDAGGPYGGGEGSDIALNGASASDTDGPSPLSYSWTIDGSSVGAGSCSVSNDTSLTLATIKCTDNGTATVTLTATEAGPGLSGSDTASVTINNVAPSGTFKTPAANVNEGTSFSLSITDVTDPSSVDSAAGFEYAFDCGSGYGSFSPTSNASCPTAVDGPAVLSVGGKVKDKDGGEREYTGSVHVVNVAPTIDSLVPGAAASCNSANSLTIDFSDPAGLNDTYSASIDWGDGNVDNPTSIASPYQASHTYASAGTYTATVSVSDEDGGTSTSMTKTLVVNYNLSALLQPINNTGHGASPSIFKYGSAVPVKVEITDCDGSHPSTLDVRVFAVKTSSIPPSDGESEAAIANQPDAGNQMRFSDPIYIFNWSTKSISDATSTVLVTVKVVATGQTVSAVIGLKSK
jgi:PKD domain